MLTQQRFTASAAAVVSNPKGEILLLDHVLRHASGWGLPGGFVNVGEHPSETVKRELCEEVGIELASVELYRVRTVGSHIEFIFVADTSENGEVQTSEIFELRWFDPGKLPDELSRQQKQLVESIFSNES